MKKSKERNHKDYEPFCRPGSIATVDKTGVYYNITDYLVSAALELDNQGNIAQKLDYLQFGAERVNEKSKTFGMRFTCVHLLFWLFSSIIGYG